MGMLGTVLESDESSEDRLLDVPAPESPGILERFGDTLENDEVWIG
jgi:hypothetical protein